MTSYRKQNGASIADNYRTGILSYSVSNIDDLLFCPLVPRSWQLHLTLPKHHHYYLPRTSLTSLAP